MREWKRYKLACGTVVDEIVNADGVVIAKTMTPPPSATPMKFTIGEGEIKDTWTSTDVAAPMYQQHVTGWSRKVLGAEVAEKAKQCDEAIADAQTHLAMNYCVYRGSPLDWSSLGVVIAPPTDPLDVEYDGVKLRELLIRDEEWRREAPVIGRCSINDYQRAAISAHWSAELRQRVEAAKEKQRTQVVVEGEDDE